MGLKRLSLLIVFAAVLSLGLASAAPAGNFDEPRMGCTGENPGICPTGTEGQPYSIPIELLGDEDEACAVYTVSSGALPPGLSVNSDGARIEGTPTQAGTYDFFLTVTYNREPTCPFKNPSDDSFRISINPGIPKLIIGPEQSGVPVGTVGAPYRLEMTANLPDAKTWSIADGALPPGTTLDPSSGVISGTPSAAGSFVFTVLAVINEKQSDTKVLAITVRVPLELTFPELETATGTRIRWEVGVPFSAEVVATGGTGTYTWRLAGVLPPGVTFQDGLVAGRPSSAGVYRFALVVTDSEERVDTYAGRLIVAPRLSIVLRPLRQAKVGKRYRSKLYARGGLAPREWELVRGSLPAGVELDPVRGILFGQPQAPGRHRVRIRIVDALGVNSAKTYLLRVAPAPKKKKGR